MHLAARTQYRGQQIIMFAARAACGLTFLRGYAPTVWCRHMIALRSSSHAPLGLICLAYTVVQASADSHIQQYLHPSYLFRDSLRLQWSISHCLH